MAANQDIVRGKSALITGGGSGINLEFARLLLGKGCSVIIGDIQLRPEAQSLLTEYPHPPTESGKPSAVFHKTDVTLWPNLTSLFNKAVESFPTVDIVVPGAGLFEPAWSTFWTAPKSETNPASVSRDVADGEPGHYAMIDVNLTHPIRLSQLAISHWTLKKQKGALIFIGSIAGYTAAINTPLYFATKHGLHGFVRSLGGLKSQLGIRSACVAPGAVRTPLLMDDPTKSGLHSEVDQMAEPREVAEVMFQLAVSEEYGDGTILECTKGETRLIPEWGLTPPGGKGASMPGYHNAANAVFEDLRTNGLQV